MGNQCPKPLPPPVEEFDVSTVLQHVASAALGGLTIYLLQHFNPMQMVNMEFFSSSQGDTPKSGVSAVAGKRKSVSKDEVAQRRKAFDDISKNDGLLEYDEFLEKLQKGLKLDLDSAELKRIWVRAFGQDSLTTGVKFEEFNKGVSEVTFLKLMADHLKYDQSSFIPPCAPLHATPSQSSASTRPAPSLCQESLS